MASWDTISWASDDAQTPDAATYYGRFVAGLTTSPIGDVVTLDFAPATAYSIPDIPGAYASTEFPTFGTYEFPDIGGTYTSANPMAATAFDYSSLTPIFTSAPAASTTTSYFWG